MTKNKVYLILFEWATDDCTGTDTIVFSSYEKAVNRYKQIIEDEKNPDISGFADAFDKDGNFCDEDGYDLDCSDFDDGEEHELWWNIQKRGDWYFHDNLELRILEVDA